MSNEDKQMTINNLIDEVFAKDREITELREQSGEYAMTIGRQAKENKEQEKEIELLETEKEVYTAYIKKIDPSWTPEDKEK